MGKLRNQINLITIKSLIMKKFFKAILAAIVSFLVGWVLWLIGYFALPHILPLGWFWIFVYYLLIISAVVGLVTSLGVVLITPLLKLCSGNKPAKIISTVMLVWWGFCCFKLPLNIHEDVAFHAVQWVWSVTWWLTIIPLFCLAIGALFSKDFDN